MKKTDFNKDWTVQKEGSTEVRNVNLPDDAMIREERKADNPSSSAGAFFAGGRYTYIKEMNVEDPDQIMILEFEGVYQEARVYLNDEEVAYRPYGYTNFFVNLTGKVKDGTNTIKVIADNSKQPNSRWYSGSGIYREVSLYTARNSYIRPEGIKVTILDTETINVKTDAVSAEGAEVKITILDKEGNEVTSAPGTDIGITIKGAHLWSADDPYLYTCKVTLKENDKTVDGDEVRFGIRTLAWGREGFLVNGKAVKLRGACIHHDNGILGACAFKDAEYRRVRILKEAGFNAIRSAHNPCSKALLDACDELGMYMMDELYDMWLMHKNPYDFGKENFRAWWKEDLRSMVSKDYNHPSVVMYSMGNEITELGNEEGQDMAREMVSLSHELDNTRPVTAGINLALAQMANLGKKKSEDDYEHKIMSNDDTKNAPTSEFFNKLVNILGDKMDKAASRKKANLIATEMRNIFDITGYNYATSRYELDGKESPEHASVGSETFTHKLYKNWMLVEKILSLIGDFMWTGYDHLGEAGIGTIRYMDKKTKKDIDEGLIVSSGAGVIDICGKQRPETSWNKIIWGLSMEPEIGVDPYTHTKHFKSKRMWRKADTIASWSWEGCEGEKADVTVYARAACIELLVNGRSLGKKKPEEYTAVFKKVPYENGTIEARALDNSGNILAVKKLESASGKTQIRLSTDKTVLSANGQDLAFIEVELTGENGIVKSSADQKLTVKVEGKGSLQAFGSARPNMMEDFVSDTHTTYYGKALAVIRSTCEEGNIKVTVFGKGLDPVTIELKAKEA